ncbi:hypothetical protein B0H67DRAFT_645697 [Lasiosphaeris hirsuta]|uniref:Uncharacterized protein n=1 Tax=Lasiosphaeris hirsuta TaxID=260670 RepID=A0AA40AHN2_9PEZI|nr:hypothetical protein B0H67DRAFT_645697 [Lasiosphaeris hirsuta]
MSVKRRGRRPSLVRKQVYHPRLAEIVKLLREMSDLQRRNLLGRPVYVTAGLSPGENVRLTYQDKLRATEDAAYDGATLVNARNRALTEAKVHAASVQGLGVVVDKAAKETAVLTSVNDGKVVRVYAHHFQDGEYHQNLVARESLLLYPNRGRELIRNTQDFARRKSYQLEALFVADMEEE